MDVNLDELVNVGNLTDWLDANVPELGKGPLKCELLHGGTSNVVFTLDRGGPKMVLRRPPAVPPPGGVRTGRPPGDCRRPALREDARHRRQKRPALRAAGAVGDVIRRERITKRIELGELFRRIKCRRHQRQHRVTELVQAGFDKSNQLGAPPNFAVLPCGFQTRGMGETTSGKRRVN